MEQNQLWKLMTERVHLRKENHLPPEYGCECDYCANYRGLLIREDGNLYNRNDRRKYYIYKHGAGGAQHINPTPLHVARWAIQIFTNRGDWVLDPFLGSGTTMVEALNHGRNCVGIELDTYELAQQNIKLTDPLREKHLSYAPMWDLYPGDARRNIMEIEKEIQLTVLHPPYSGDEQSNAKYDPNVINNMAFMKENEKYWDDMAHIFNRVYELTRKGGWVVLGVKEMMRNKKWWDLHNKFCTLLEGDFSYKGMVLLPHYPRTLHLNTYYQRWGVHPSYWQQIYCFQKGE